MPDLFLRKLRTNNGLGCPGNRKRHLGEEGNPQDDSEERSQGVGWVEGADSEQSWVDLKGGGIQEERRPEESPEALPIHGEARERKTPRLSPQQQRSYTSVANIHTHNHIIGKHEYWFALNSTILGRRRERDAGTRCARVCRGHAAGSR